MSPNLHLLLITTQRAFPIPFSYSKLPWVQRIGIMLDVGFGGLLTSRPPPQGTKTQIHREPGLRYRNNNSHLLMGQIMPKKNQCLVSVTQRVLKLLEVKML